MVEAIDRMRRGANLLILGGRAYGCGAYGCVLKTGHLR